jgi:hypothetical protein
MEEKSALKLGISSGVVHTLGCGGGGGGGGGGGSGSSSSSSSTSG